MATVLTTTGISTPTGIGSTVNNGFLFNIQYFSTAGTFTYTATTGTNFIIVEVVAGGGQSGGASSFGAFCSATANGVGSGGDINCGGNGGDSGYAGTSAFGYGGGAAAGSAVGNGGGRGANQGGGGGARKKITSGFSGTTVTVGAGNVGGTGIVIVYEYS